MTIKLSSNLVEFVRKGRDKQMKMVYDCFSTRYRSFSVNCRLCKTSSSGSTVCACFRIREATFDCNRFSGLEHYNIKSWIVCRWLENPFVKISYDSSILFYGIAHGVLLCNRWEVMYEFMNSFRLKNKWLIVDIFSALQSIIRTDSYLLSSIH